MRILHNLGRKQVTHVPDSDRPHEECGVFGIYLPDMVMKKNPNLVVTLSFNGGYQNQHRGEEAFGIVTANGFDVSPVYKNLGLVAAVAEKFKKEADVKEFNGHIGLAHNRYSTTGSSTRNNAGPFTSSSALGTIAVAHNGNLTNAQEIAKQLTAKGVIFKSTTDSEIVAVSIAQATATTWENKIAQALSGCQGSFSLGMLTSSALYAARDSLGNRPLFWAEFNESGQAIYAISSETPAFSHLNGYHLKRIREVLPGTIVKFDTTGVTQKRFSTSKTTAFCGLEMAYLSRADAIAKKGVQIDTIRRRLGARLAQLYPPPKDIDAVTYIPESSRPAAEGLAAELGSIWQRQIMCLTSMMKGRYPSLDGKSRGFMSPTNEQRKAVATNYYMMDWIRGKKIVLVDDSVIRGFTTAGVIAMCRQAGVKEIHLRIPWPPVQGHCPLGTDINLDDKLLWIECRKNLEVMRKTMMVDSLAFLSPEEYQETIDQAIGTHLGLCMGCTTGNYPVHAFNADKNVFEKTC